MQKNQKIKRALISVSNKTGLVAFVQELDRLGITVLSTGGTLKSLRDAGIQAVAVDTYTGFPEILDGRVKTLHPKIHGGLLFRRDKKDHCEQARKMGIEPIDMVVVNLYPFEQVIAKGKVSREEAIENIDIGGPSMLRSAAKNADAVTVVCDPDDYSSVIEDLKRNQGFVSQELKRQLAVKVFERTSSYDHAIAAHLKAQLISAKEDSVSTEELPEKLDVVYTKAKVLRYGENPHQRAALYTASSREPKFEYKQLHGKELSFNNLLDINAVIDILREFEGPVACVVKHNNPCGIAEDPKLEKAMHLAIESDSLSAFGGILGVNRPCDVKTAGVALEKLKFFEVIIAPSYAKEALEKLKERKNLRIISTGPLGEGGPYDMRFVKDGILLQDRDKSLAGKNNALKKSFKVVTKKKLKPAEVEQLLFAWRCVKTVKSNAIVLTQGRQTVGVGAGQMSRVDSVFIACHKAGPKTDGSFLASDAFFPMPDAIEEAARHKIRAIIQPGGSVRDADIIAACDQAGLAMIFTGQRHFRH